MKSSTPRENLVASTPFFEHLEQEFGRQVLSAQTCASYEPATEGERWYCAKTHPNMEYVALVHLAKMGFAAHVALFAERTMRNPSKANGIRRGTFVLRRCFPGYVFVALDFRTDTWPRALEARGFSGLLKRANGEAVPVPWLDMFDLLRLSAGEIEKLQASRAAGQRQRELREAEAARPLRKRSFVNLTQLSEDERLTLLHKVMARRFSGDDGSDEAA